MNKILANNKLIPAEVMEEIALRLEIQGAEWENVEGDMYLIPADMQRDESSMITLWAHADHMNEVGTIDDLPLTYKYTVSTHGIQVAVYEEVYIDIIVCHVLVVNN